MNETYVKAAFGWDDGQAITIKGNANNSTKPADYDEDADKIIVFLNRLPSGTVERVRGHLNNPTYYRNRGK